MLPRIHRDAYAVVLGIVLLVGLVAVLLLTVNPIR